jgi:hypothetical protein
MTERACPLCDEAVAESTFGAHLADHSTLSPVDPRVESTWLYALFVSLLLTVAGVSLTIGTQGPGAALPAVAEPVGALVAVVGLLLGPVAIYQDLDELHASFGDAPLLHRLLALVVVVPLLGQLLGVAAYLVGRNRKTSRLDTVAARVDAALEDRQAADEAMGVDAPDRADDFYERSLDALEEALELARASGLHPEPAIDRERSQVHTLLQHAERREDELERREQERQGELGEF